VPATIMTIKLLTLTPAWGCYRVFSNQSAVRVSFSSLAASLMRPSFRSGIESSIEMGLFFSAFL
jgi:hypothetical protein